VKIRNFSIIRARPWNVCWPRIHAVLENVVLYRGQQNALGGIESVLANLSHSGRGGSDYACHCAAKACSTSSLRGETDEDDKGARPG
jgi:hypothetical protein